MDNCITTLKNTDQLAQITNITIDRPLFGTTREKIRGLHLEMLFSQKLNQDFSKVAVSSGDCDLLHGHFLQFTSSALG